MASIETTLRGGYVPFSLKRDYHLDAFRDTINELNRQHEQALQTQASLRIALDKFNLNEAEDEFKQNYIDSVMNQIDNAARFGNYSSALSTATRLAGEATVDPKITSRARANEEYEKEKARQLDRLSKNEISQSTYNWWLKNNPYSFTEKEDDYGNVVGGKLNWTTKAPVNDIDFAKHANLAFRLLSPYKSSTSSDGTTTVNNQTLNPITRFGNTYPSGEQRSEYGHHTDTREYVSIDDIRNNMEELLSATGDGYKQVEQAFNVAYNEYMEMEEDYKDMKAKYEKLVAENPIGKETSDFYKKLLNAKQQLDARKKFMYKNGSIIDYNEYYARMITDSLYAKGMAYDWRTSSHGGSKSYSVGNPAGYRSGRGNSGEGDEDEKNTNNTTFWDGVRVQMQTDMEDLQQNVQNAADNIVNSF